MFLISIQGIVNRLSAAVFKQYSVYIRADNRPKLNSNEYLIRDLVGLKCFVAPSVLPFGIVVGVVTPDELCEGSAAALMHSMLEVKLQPSGALCLIPLVPAIVLEVDLERGQLLVDPPTGLLELTYAPSEVNKALRGFLPGRATGITEEERRYLVRHTTYIRSLDDFD
jgi:16S rRNA processing protein RimM